MATSLKTEAEKLAYELATDKFYWNNYNSILSKLHEFEAELLRRLNAELGTLRCPTCERYGWSHCSDSWHSQQEERHDDTRPSVMPHISDKERLKLEERLLDFENWLRVNRGITVNHSVTPHDWVELGKDYAEYRAQFLPSADPKNGGKDK